MLQQRYGDNRGMLSAIPNHRQIESRKSYLVRSTPGGYDLRDYARFHAWVSQRLATKREEFFQVTDTNDPRMDEMTTLNSLVTDDKEGDQPRTFGVIITSRRAFNNTATAVSDQRNGLVCSTDGTYKLHFGGWTVVDCGTEAVVWLRNTFVHRFIPWDYMFVRFDSSEAYIRMFETIKARALRFFGVSVDVSYEILNHPEAIASAFLHVWPRITLLTCYPHLVRQLRNKCSLLTDSDHFGSLILLQLQMVRSARTHSQFLKISSLVVAHWEAEGDHAEWFERVYLLPWWNH